MKGIPESELSEDKSAGLTMRIELKKGAIKNGYVSFPLSQSIFPIECYGDGSGKKKGRLFTLVDELGKSYSDDIRVSGNMGRIRARFGTYFKSVKAKEGDVIEITLQEPGKYTMRLNPSAASQTISTSLKIPAAPYKEHLHEIKSMTAKNIILYGPPGTGKTYSTTLRAVQICAPDWPSDANDKVIKEKYEELYKAGRISFVTFHQSYGYEDFVEGLRPELKDGQVSVSYSVRSGIFLQACEAAKLSTENHVLIIDEINRANISKVFGELITLLEPDKRAGETNAITVKLPSSGADFSVPPNLYVIGTMNTADRSIALLDTALRRRFEFEELQPNYAALPEESIEGVDLRTMLQAINDRIEYLYDRDHTIGHAYFINVKSLSDMEMVFRRKIIPLLQEYFYEDWAKVRLALNDKDGSFIEEKNDIPKGLESIADGYGSKSRYIVRDKFTDDAYRRIYA